MSNGSNSHDIHKFEQLIEICNENDGDERQMDGDTSSHIESQYQCLKCDFIDASAENVKRHYSGTHEDCKQSQKEEELEEEVIYVCSLCYRQYTLIDDLKGHMIVFHKLRPVCTELPSVSRSQEKLEDQQSSEITISNDAINIKSEEVKPALLQMVPVPFKEFKLILRSTMTLRCTSSMSCLYKFENMSKLEAHQKCHNSSGVQNFRCTECRLEFKSWRRCSIHLWKAHKIDVDIMQCPLCSFKAATSVLVWRHMCVHKKWRNKVLKSLKAAQKKRKIEPLPANSSSHPPESNEVPHHILQNSSQKSKYYSEKTCDICERKFANTKTLSKHVKSVHNKIKPFICNICGKKLARKITLMVHMRQHTGEKPLQCNSCKFTARDPSVIKKHQMRHEKTRKHNCTKCSYSSIQTSALKHHIRLYHPEEFKNISCTICEFVTMNPEKLAAHKEDHRKGLITNYEDSLDATRTNLLKNPRKMRGKHLTNAEISSDCFLPLESVDSIPHVPALDTGGVTIPAPSEDTQFPSFLNN